jgi:hypothetical protein
VFDVCEDEVPGSVDPSARARRALPPADTEVDCAALSPVERCSETGGAATSIKCRRGGPPQQDRRRIFSNILDAVRHRWRHIAPTRMRRETLTSISCSPRPHSRRADHAMAGVACGSGCRRTPDLGLRRRGTPHALPMPLAFRCLRRDSSSYIDPQPDSGAFRTR